jgi:UDP-N-acetylmuramoyl-tripeptide--D-alanyl-D-alanine ligase
MYSVEKLYTEFFRPDNVCTDSRKLKPGDIFIALRGDNFNGNEFAETAINQGAALAIIDDKSYETIRNTVLVENSLQFLQELAIFHKKRSGFHVIGLTGTNGKTTTKELINSVLSEKFKCQSTAGNLNNHIGVPLTILSIQHNTEYAIIEMGANHPGEIQQLCEICLPDSGLITNIGRAHLEGFGGFEGVKKTKAELFQYLKKKNGKIYYNASNPLLTELIENYPNAIPYNGNADSCTGKTEAVEPALIIRIYNGSMDSIMVSSNLYGEYNLENIMAATCIGLDLGLSLQEIKSGIEKYTPSNNRSQLVKIGSTTLILDCYNANPSSMQESLHSFSKLPDGIKVVVLGEMKELGAYSKSEHKKLTEIIDSYNFNEVIFIGNEFSDFKIKNSKYFETVLDFKDFFTKSKYNNTAILIKGSRANRLERVLEFFN